MGALRADGLMFGISFSKFLVMVLALVGIFVVWRSIRLLQNYFSARQSAFRRPKGPEPRIMDLVVCKNCGAYNTASATHCFKCGAKQD